MPDVVDKQTRSRMMSGIRGKNTLPEIQIRSALHRRGFRFRIHDARLPGKPDLVLPRYRAVVFVHGCFWHHHDCHLFKWPSTRADWWAAKLNKTVETDARHIAALREAGWRVAIVWECALKGRTRLEFEDVVNALAEWLPSDSPDLTIRGRNET